MILLGELEIFCADWLTKRPNLENWFMVASDDELLRLYRETVNANDSCTMVCLVPTNDANIADEDNRKLQNNLTFMVLKKTDSKAGHDAKLDVFKLTQIEIKALLVEIVDLHHNFGKNCTFRDIDLNSIRIDPVQDYLGANGFEIEFTTLSQF